MSKRLLSILLFSFLSFVLHSQNDRKIINGIITSDSLAVNDIHVINKNSRKATLTNKLGEFQIPVKVNDTLLFSAIQFERKEIIIKSSDFKKLIISIQLKPKINQISEVKVRKTENIAKELNLPNAKKKPLNKHEARLNGHSKANVPLAILDALLIGPLLGKKGGINNLHYILSGKRKADRKLAKHLEEDKFNVKKEEDLQNIRTHFKDSFFISQLKILKGEIDYFLDHCYELNVVTLYYENRFLEIIEIFFNERDVYLDTVKKE